MKNILTLTLNPSTDHILTIREICLHSKNLLSESQIFYGGKGVNVALALGKLGVPATAAGLMSGKDQKGFSEKLASVGIKSAFTKINGNTRRAYKIMETETGSDTEFNQAGSPVTHQEMALLVDDLGHLFKSISWVALCGSIPPGLPTNIYAELIQMCKQSGVSSCLDSSGEVLIEGVKAQPDILRINRTELGEILSQTITNQVETINAIRTIQATGIGKVIVSMGAEGTIGYDGNDMVCIKVPEVKIRGLTGAGDAMTAGVLASILQGKSFPESLRFSSAIATASTLMFEPSAFDPHDLSSILEKTTIEIIQL